MNHRGDRETVGTRYLRGTGSEPVPLAYFAAETIPPKVREQDGTCVILQRTVVANTKCYGPGRW